MHAEEPEEESEEWEEESSDEESEPEEESEESEEEREILPRSLRDRRGAGHHSLSCQRGSKASLTGFGGRLFLVAVLAAWQRKELRTPFLCLPLEQQDAASAAAAGIPSRIPGNARDAAWNATWHDAPWHDAPWHGATPRNAARNDASGASSWISSGAPHRECCIPSKTFL